MSYIKDHPLIKLSELRVLTSKDLVQKGRNMIPEVFYVHSFHGENLEEHRPAPNYDMNHWDEWIKAGRVYIPKENDLLI